MNLNTFYKEEDVDNRYYFKYKVLDEEILLSINDKEKSVYECSICMEAYADIELTIIPQLEELVYYYFDTKYNYFQTLSNRYNKLSRDIYV